MVLFGSLLSTLYGNRNTKFLRKSCSLWRTASYALGSDGSFIRCEHDIRRFL